jgi:hypothetical protein
MSDKPTTDKPKGKHAAWKWFLWIFGAFMAALAVSIVTSEHDNKHPLAAHPGLDPCVWIFLAGIAWIMARLLTR